MMRSNGRGLNRISGGSIVITAPNNVESSAKQKIE